MWKLAILSTLYPSSGGWHVWVGFLDPGAGLTSTRIYSSFSAAYVDLMRSGWEPIHAEMDSVNLMTTASFRKPASRPFFWPLRDFIRDALSVRVPRDKAEQEAIPAGDEFSRKLQQALSGQSKPDQ